MAQKPQFPARINSDHSLAKGLLSAWLFNEGAGPTAFDTGPKRIPAAFSGPPQWKPGKFGAAIEFGVATASTRLNIGNGGVSLSNVTGYTVSFWIRPLSGQTDAGYAAIFTNDDSFPGDGIYYSETTGKLNFYFSPGDHTWTGTLTTGKWHHAALVVAPGGGIQFYLDGKLDSTTSGANSWIAVYIGGITPSNEPFKGSLDHVLAWGRALTAAEIRQLYVDPFAVALAQPAEEGIVPVAGGRTADLNATIGNLTLAADATHPVTANASPTIGNLSLSSAASHPVTADASAAIPNLTLSSAATHPVTANASPTIGPITLSATASGGTQADLAATIGNLTLSSSATVRVTADASPTIGNISLSSAATHPVTADASAAIPNLTLSSAATHPVTANASPTIGNIALSSSASTGGTAEILADFAGLIPNIILSSELANRLHIICDGTSLTQGSFLPNPTTDCYPTQLGRTIGSAYTITNLGIGGQRGDTMLANFATKVAPLYDATKRQAIIFEMGTNDMAVEGASVDTVLTRYRDYYDRCRAVGWSPTRIFIRPLSPRSSDSLTFTEANRVFINRWLTLNFPHSVVDPASEPRIYGPWVGPHFAAGDVWFLDSVHPTVAGTALDAEAIRKKLVREGFLPNEFTAGVGSRARALSDGREATAAVVTKRAKAVFV
jgi:hypothetical protein